MSLSDREYKIVMATIKIWNENYNSGFVPDSILHEMPKSWPIEFYEKIEIRDLVQSIKPRKFSND